MPLMSKLRTYPEPPVELPIDPWLLEGEPTDGCGVCMALARERREALARDNLSKAIEASRELRNHKHTPVG